MANVIKHKRGSGSDPAASDLVVGEVAIRTDVGKLFTKMDNGSVAEIAGGGSDIVINTLSSSSATGGGSATFNGSAYRFTLSAPPSVSAQQLLVSINGVIQKPVAGTGQPSEGFSVDGTDIILGDAPATGSDFFILTFKSLGVSEPADNSVTSAKIANGAIVDADINTSAAIAGTKISPDFGSQNIDTTGTLSVGQLASPTKITAGNPTLRFIQNNNSLSNRGYIQFYYNTSNLSARISGKARNSANGQLHFDVEKDSTLTNILLVDDAGIDITGNITGTGNLTIDTNTLHVDSSNNRVGIGTTSPVAPFHVAHSGTSTAVGTNFISLRSGASGRDIGIQFSDSATSAYVGMLGGAIYFADSGSNEKLRIESGGGLKFTGQGTSIPVGGILHHTNNNLYVRGGTNGLVLGNQDNTNTIHISDSNFIKFETSDGTERLRIDSAGRVGIGVTSANDTSTALTIKNMHSGNDHTQLEIICDDNETSRITFSETSTLNNGSIRYNFVSDTRAMTFHTNGNTERMRIDSSGHILPGADSSYNIGSNSNRFANGYFDTLYGDGSNLTGISGVTIGGNANNRIITGSDTANTLQADADVTYDAATSDFSILGSKPGTSMDLIVQNNGGGNAAGARITIQSGSAANTGPQFGMICGSHNWYLQVPKAAGNLEFNNNGSPAFNMLNSNDFLIYDGDLVLGTAGHGIDFSNQSASSSGGATTNAELLDHYEEGEWTPVANISGVGSVTLHSPNRCRYTRVGRMVHITARFTPSGSSGSSNLIIGGLPFNSGSSNASAFCIMHDGFDEGGSQEPVLMGFVGQGTANISFYYTRTNGVGWQTVIGTEAVDHEIIFEFSYYTDS